MIKTASIKNHLIFNFLGQGWSSLMGLLFIPFYIHYLGMDSYGLIGVFVVIQACFAFIDMGLSTTITRETTEFFEGANGSTHINDFLWSLELITFALSFVIGVIVWQGSEYIALYWLKTGGLSSDAVAESLSIMGVIIALRLYEGIYKGALYGMHMQVWFNITNVGISTLRYAGVLLVLIFISPNVIAFFIWQLMISALSVLILRSRIKKALPKIGRLPKFNLLAFSNRWKFAGGIMSISLMSVISMQVDKVFLSRMLDLASFGAYMLSVSMASLLYAAMIPVTQAFYPHLTASANHKDKKGLSRGFHLGAQIITVITTPMMLVLCIFGENLVYVWSGDMDLAKRVAPILAPIVLGTYLNGLMHMPYQLQIAHGWTRLMVKLTLIFIPVFILSLVWIAPIYGAIGAGWCWVGLNVGYLFLAGKFMDKTTLSPEIIRWYIKDIIIPLIVTSATVLLLKTQISLVDFQRRWTWLALLIFAGSLSLIVAALSASEIRHKIKEIIKLPL